jgi:flagellar transcriptional activator FlhD
MPAPDFIDEIRELNLTFLLLAQRMAQENIEAAAVKLGVEIETLRWLQGLSPVKLVRIAQGAMLVPHFRFDGELLRGLAGEGAREETAAQVHALILGQQKGRKVRIVGEHHDEKE